MLLCADQQSRFGSEQIQRLVGDEPGLFSVRKKGEGVVGYPAREQGRYGSHPSHDRFDGDSEPWFLAIKLVESIGRTDGAK